MPSENEKLRALLAEARDTLRDFAENWDCDADAHKYGTVCRVCDADAFRKRIDAALAEPVAAPTQTGIAASKYSDLLKVYSMAITDRDKARAEVEKLEAEVWGLQLELRRRRVVAFRRGAEAMRKALRALPIPEDKP